MLHTCDTGMAAAPPGRLVKPVYGCMEVPVPHGVMTACWGHGKSAPRMTCRVTAQATLCKRSEVGEGRVGPAAVTRGWAAGPPTMLGGSLALNPAWGGQLGHRWVQPLGVISCPGSRPGCSQQSGARPVPGLNSLPVVQVLVRGSPVLVPGTGSPALCLLKPLGPPAMGPSTHNTHALHSDPEASVSLHTQPRSAEPLPTFMTTGPLWFLSKLTCSPGPWQLPVSSSRGSLSAHSTDLSSSGPAGQRLPNPDPIIVHPVQPLHATLASPPPRHSPASVYRLSGSPTVFSTRVPTPGRVLGHSGTSEAPVGMTQGWAVWGTCDS